MKKKPYNLKLLMRWVITLVGMAIGGSLVALLLRLYLTIEQRPPLPTPLIIFFYVGVSLFSALISWFIAPGLIDRVQRWSGAVESALSDTPLAQVLSSVLGMILGLIIATLVTQLFRTGMPDMLWAGMSAIAYLMLGYLGGSLGARRWREFLSLFSGKAFRSGRKAESSLASGAKLLDTSVLIDGRILDVCKTGFVEGPLIVPQFVLSELQHIADSSDPLRRTRGRRGLDILSEMQQSLQIEVQITDADVDDEPEVDVKLLKLAQQSGDAVITNDFNLNKVASVAGVRVLNLNDLAGALRPVLLPGEEMTVHILREGKEYGQGVGYLDDGTMIVVDNGKRYLGQTLTVLVTSVLQTSAGRMIFTKIKEDLSA